MVDDEKLTRLLREEHQTWDDYQAVVRRFEQGEATRAEWDVAYKAWCDALWALDEEDRKHD